MKLTFATVAVCLILGGCSSTWQGVKSDSSDMWDKTKQASSDAYHSAKKSIHEATAE